MSNEGGTTAAATGAADPPLESAAAFCLASSTSASVSANSPSAAPTSAVSPAGTTIAAKMPSLNDSTSMSALSDSTTKTVSPFSILSPGDLSQEVIFPSVMVELRAGMKIS